MSEKKLLDVTWVVAVPGDPDTREQVTFKGCDVNALMEDPGFNKRLVSGLVQRLEARIAGIPEDDPARILTIVTEVQQVAKHWPPGEPVGA